MSKAKSVYNGVLWSFLQLFIDRGLSFIVKIVLAKLLFPEDFGLIGMAAVFIAFLQPLSEVGMASYLINKKDPTETDLSTTFWTGIVWAIVLYTFVNTVVANFAASFYNEPIIKTIFPVLSIGVLTNSLNMIKRVKLVKNLDFKRIALVENISNLISAVIALTLAFLDFGLWALVAYNSVAFLIRLVMFHSLVQWRPKFIWSNESFKNMFSFGLFTLGTAMLSKVVSQFDFMIVGKLLNATLLGYYSFAFLITSTLRTQISFALTKVMYPVFSQNKSDTAKMHQIYGKLVFYNYLILFPVLLGLFLFSDVLINTFFSKWEPTIDIIRILSVGVMLALFNSGSGVFIRGFGKPKIEFRLSIANSILFVIIIFLGVYFYGLIGLSVSFVIFNLVSVIIIQLVLKIFFGLSFVTLFKAIQRVLLIGLINLSVYYVLQFLGGGRLILLGVYLLINISLYLLWYRKEFMFLIKKIRP
ncbi:lipopolysaccharide biosynthesis protein [Fulvivirga maritima]|uniref:lipopolysaccharide biosynthesis protein n=1 Tax=Fulvivirga maritima TaxID=2904247 RepID=UPI001F1C11EB|nr:lipopolysaccharide biosynthesis protein [Fulvivirga maritima]UII24836.1 lipopolysaccharide biosynthesis protein [Fulvivirga maritima]